MKIKKFLALLLACAMLMSVLVACGKQEEAAEPEAPESAPAEQEAPVEEASKEVVFPLEEKMTFTVFAAEQNSETTNIPNNLAWQKAFEMANIDFEFTEIVSFTDVAEKRNLVINSGDYPEVFMRCNLEADKYGEEGILIPLEDLIREYAPNLTKKLDELNGWGHLQSPDGHIYAMPNISVAQPGYPPIWINKAWLDNLGLEEPKSYDDLYNVLKAFKEQDANGNGDPNDEIPYFPTSGWPMWELIVYEDFLNERGADVGIKDGEVFHLKYSESYKDILAFGAKLYQEGLMYKDAYTTNEEQRVAIAQSTTDNTVGMFADWAPYFVVGNDIAKDAEYIWLKPFQEGTLALQDSVSKHGLYITDKCKNPEVIVAFCDYFYSEEGAILRAMGVEGETYKMHEDGTFEYLVGNGYGDTVTDVRNNNTINNNSIFGAMPDLYYNMKATEGSELEAHLRSERGTVAPMCAPFPALALTAEENDQIATILTDMNLYAATYEAEVVTGVKDLEATWDEYMATMKNMGADTVNAVYQAAYDREMAANN